MNSHVSIPLDQENKKRGWGGGFLIIFIVHGTLLTYDALIRHYSGLKELIYD